MDFVTTTPYGITPRKPIFLQEASVIATIISKYTQAEIMDIMHVSETIAKSVMMSYAAWGAVKPGKVALWTYTGDVYKGLRALTLKRGEADWAQEHLLISSGLYGVVRPYDGVQAYRLEMNSKIVLGQSRNLRDYWGSELAHYVRTRRADWVCCLSSEEYAQPVLDGLSTHVITPVFLDNKPNGTLGTVPIYSKIMRGVMARWMINNQIEHPSELKQFAGHGYAYDAAHSTESNPTYSRAVMKPIRFD
jgi:cytoplasmic iron level regulating protein YaaA (DUF328/UPF0246 family)